MCENALKNSTFYNVPPHIFSLTTIYQPLLLQSTHNRLHGSWSEAATLARTIYPSVSAFLSMSYSFVARCRLSNKWYIKIKLNFYIFLSLAAVTRSMCCTVAIWEGGVKCMVAYSSINDARHVCVAMRNGLVSQFLFYVFCCFLLCGHITYLCCESVCWLK